MAMGLFQILKEAFTAVPTFDDLNDEFYDGLEEALILADVGADTAADTVAQLRKRVKERFIGRMDEVKDALRDILKSKLEVGDGDLTVHVGDDIAGLQLVHIRLYGEDQVAHLDMVLGAAAHGAGLHHHGRDAQHRGRKLRVYDPLDDDRQVADEHDGKYDAQHHPNGKYDSIGCFLFSHTVILPMWYRRFYSPQRCDPRPMPEAPKA